MGHRRKARECALQVLYQMEMRDSEPKETLALFFKNGEVPEEEPIRAFLESLVFGVCRNRIEIDPMIEKYSTNWKLARMAVVDRNLLRIGVYELLYLREIPPSVIINESVEIAKRFGNHDSASFANGVLDQIAREIRK